MVSEWRDLRKKILAKITPDDAERRAVEDFIEKTENELTNHLHKHELVAVAEVHGSAARDTWLKGERDIDVFIILDPGYDRNVLSKILDTVKVYIGNEWIEAYAEHPYLQANIDGFNVEFVPCYRINHGQRLISATDRTPLHTQFVKKNLAPEGSEEVRLIKKYMQGIGVYGAEVKIGGFSGYLCELLIIHYSSFEEVLSSAKNWKNKEVIDLTGNTNPDILRKKFREPLIVVDPVDPRRNVASAVSDTSNWTFVASARAFLKEPKENFFSTKKIEIDIPTLKALRRLDSNLIFVSIEDDQVDVADVLWGQLHKATRSIAKLLSKEEFKVIRTDTWSNEKSKHILIFELESTTIPKAAKIRGPPVEMAESSQRFLQAHLGAPSTISGPWIEGRRWWLESRRLHTEARQLLSTKLKDGGRNIGIPRRLSEKIARKHEVMIDQDAAIHMHGNFANFLNVFLRGRPVWLD